MARTSNNPMIVSLTRIFLLSLTLTVIVHPGLWSAVANGYAEDYLFNLSKTQIAGLLVITGVLALLLYLACIASTYFLCKWLYQYTSRWIMILASISIALILCAIALALVPQLHYQYYRMILPGLPLQWVPLGDLSATTLWKYFFLPANGNTTVHAKGVTVWICVSASALMAFEQSRK